MDIWETRGAITVARVVEQMFISREEGEGIAKSTVALDAVSPESYISAVDIKPKSVLVYRTSEGRLPFDDYEKPC